MKDKNGRVLEEPRVAMLMEELEKVNESFLFLFQVWLVFLSLAAGVTKRGMKLTNLQPSPIVLLPTR